MVKFGNTPVPRSFIESIIGHIDLILDDKTIPFCVDCALDLIEKGKDLNMDCKKCAEIRKELTRRKKLKIKPICTCEPIRVNLRKST